MKNTHTHTVSDSLSINDLGSRLCSPITDRYGVDQRLASEMAWDLLEIMSAIDSDLEALDRYYIS